MAKKKIGDIYVEKGLLTEEQKNKILAYTQKKGLKFLDAILELELVPEDKLIAAFGEGYKYDYHALDMTRLPLKEIKALKPEIIAKYGIILLKKMDMASSLTVHVYGMLNPVDINNKKEELKPHIHSPLKAVLIEAQELFEILDKELSFPIREAYQHARHPLHPMLFNACKKIFGDIPRNTTGEITNKNKVIHPEDIQMPPTQVQELNRTPTEYQIEIKPEGGQDSEDKIDQILSRQGKRFDMIKGIEISLPIKNPGGSTESEILNALTMDISHSGLKIYGASVNSLTEDQTYDMSLLLNSSGMKRLLFKGQIIWKSDINDVPVAGVRLAEIQENLKKTWNVLVSYSGMRDNKQEDETK